MTHDRANAMDRRVSGGMLRWTARVVVSGTATIEAVLAALDERPRTGDGHLVGAVLRSHLSWRQVRA